MIKLMLVGMLLLAMPGCVHLGSNATASGPISMTIFGTNGTNTGTGSNTVSGYQNPVITVPVSPTGGGTPVIGSANVR